MRCSTTSIGLFSNILISLVLIAAAATKAVSPPAAGLGAMSWRHAWSALIIFEACAGLWFLLVAVDFPRISRLFGIVLFSVFLVYSMAAWGRGEPCRCFGHLSTPPWLPVGVDLSALAVLVAQNSTLAARTGKLEIPWSRLRRVGFASLAAAVVGGVSVLAFLPPIDIRRSGDVVGLRTVVLQPHRWLNEPFPLASYVDSPSTTMDEGESLVMLYHPDCAHCQLQIPQVVNLFCMAHLDPMQVVDSTNLLLIDVSGRTEPSWEVPGLVAFGRLTGAWQWFVAPPVYVELKNGCVANVVAGGGELADVEMLPVGGRHP